MIFADRTEALLLVYNQAGRPQHMFSFFLNIDIIENMIKETKVCTMLEKNNRTRYNTLTQEMLDAFSALSYYSPLPGERELGELFGVSRPTVRRALRILEDERKVIRIQGRGTFYIGNKRYIEQNKTDSFAFNHEVVSHGNCSYSKVITQNIEPATQDIAESLLISENEEVFRLERLLVFGEDFCSLTNSFIPYKLCPALIRMDFTNMSLYSKLQENGIYPNRIDKILETIPCGSYEALHIGIRQGEPLSYIQTLAYDRNGCVIEYARNYSPAYKTRHEMVSYFSEEEQENTRANKNNIT